MLCLFALQTLDAALIWLLVALVVAAGCIFQHSYPVGHPAAAPQKFCSRPWRMGNALGAADVEPDFDLGPVDDMQEVLGGDGGMLGATTS